MIAIEHFRGERVRRYTICKFDNCSHEKFVRDAEPSTSASCVGALKKQREIACEETAWKAQHWLQDRYASWGHAAEVRVFPGSSRDPYPLIEHSRMQRKKPGLSPSGLPI